MVKKVLVEDEMKPETMRFKIGFWTWISFIPTGIYTAVIGEILQNHIVMATGIGILLLFFIPLTIVVGVGIYSDHKKEVL